MVADWIAVAGTKRKHARLKVGRAIFHRNRIEGHEKVMRDYFLSGCTFPAYMFCRRSRITERLFRRIADAMEANKSFFQQQRSALI